MILTRFIVLSFAMATLLASSNTGWPREFVAQNPSERSLFDEDSSDGDLTKRFVVVIDAGHGGSDNGAQHNYNGQNISEKDITLRLAQGLAYKLRTFDVPVILTRSADEFVTLDMRAAIANRARATLFISIHANSSRNFQDSGIETYVLNATNNQASQRLASIENGKGHHVPTLSLILSDLETTANHSESIELACLTQKTVLTQLSEVGLTVKDRGVRQALFYLLMQTHMPSILFETGFGSNPLELSRLMKGRYRDRLTTAMAKAVLDYRTMHTSKFKDSGARLSAIRKQGRRCKIL